MLRPDFPTVKPVGGADPVRPAEAAGDARQQAFERALSGLLNKTVKAEVLARLTDGSSLVRVAGNAVRLQLPAGAQVGTQVPVTLVSLTPRPTFQIGAETAQASFSEAGPALLPGPDGAAARGAPLVYLEGGPVPTRSGQATTGTPVQQAGAAAADTAEAAAGAPGAAPADGPHAAAHAAQAPATGNPAQASLAALTAEAAQTAQAALAALTAEAEAAASAPAQRAPASGGAEAEAPPGAAAATRAQYAAGLLNKALAPASHLPDIDPHSTPAHLSAGAQVLTAVLAAAAQAGAPEPAVVARTPLLPAPGAAPGELAQSLRQAVDGSGLFYESHLKEWEAGERSLAQLAREPQLQGKAEGAPVRSGQPVDPATAAFVNNQLAAQEQGRIVWQGPLWPGQHMEWDIQRDAQEQQGAPGQDEAATPWRSGLRLSFPLLGDIAATVVLHQGQARIQVEAGPDAGALLRSYARQLDDALAAAGTPLAALDIRARGAGDV
ncbi:MAG TPA: flagellar hook-length control protein FliK [Telluria sp.]|nr:flagellar hook-length control protein FliK [Telluria sp.]